MTFPSLTREDKSGMISYASNLIAEGLSRRSGIQFVSVPATTAIERANLTNHHNGPSQIKHSRDTLNQ